MPHYHTEGFANDWKLVRETGSSQKFRVTTPDGVKLEVDIHYTPGKILTANIVVEGQSSKGLLTPVMEEIGRLGLYRNDYGVIDYTLAETAQIIDGNYSIDPNDRKHRQP